MTNTSMNEKIKIIVAGIGGVGGFFGGLLARHFFDSPEVDIYFLARGEHLKQIQANGLKVLKGNTHFTAKPRSATNNAQEIGIADYIILCTKSYDLEKTIEQLKPCVDSNTSILPLLNGVTSSEQIKTILPDADIFNGCAYIVSHLKEAGIVENTGNIQRLYFGQENTANEKLLLLDKIFRQSTIESTLTNNITSVVWEKFHLVGANSSATSYFNCSTGEILASKTKSDFLLSLLQEVNQIALARGIIFDRDMISLTMEKLRSFPFETTSSMQRDFQKSDTRTELETITGFVVRSGQQLNIKTPTSNIVYNALLTKSEISK